MIKYRIYPTLLDSYEYMCEADTEEEARRREDELIQKLCRVHTEPSYAASKGTALNNCVDAVIMGKAVDLTLAQWESGEETESGVFRTGTPEAPELATKVDGFAFRFSEELVLDLADHVGDAVCQPFLSSTVDTEYGEVELYGFADYVNRDTIYDLKSTAAYTAGKYRKHWQHRIYPLIAVKSGKMERVHEFQYLVVEFGKSVKMPFDGSVFSESYMGAASEAEVVRYLEFYFLPWLEMKRPLITNDRVFGGE